MLLRAFFLFIKLSFHFRTAEELNIWATAEAELALLLTSECIVSHPLMCGLSTPTSLFLKTDRAASRQPTYTLGSRPKAESSHSHAHGLNVCATSTVRHDQHSCDQLASRQFPKVRYYSADYPTLLRNKGGGEHIFYKINLLSLKETATKTNYQKIIFSPNRYLLPRVLPYE